MTYEKIIAPLAKMVTRLEEYEKKNKSKVSELETQIEFLKIDKLDAETEASKATVAAEKIANLFK